MNMIKTIHHVDRVFTLSDSGDDFTPPGQGKVFFQEIIISAQPGSETGAFTLSALIRGENIAHIFAHVLLLDQDLNQVFGPVFQEYLVPEQTKEVNGVHYPVWEGEIQAAYEFRPRLPVLSAGEQASLGFAAPEKFVLNQQEQTYRVTGKYVFSGEEKEQNARLSFDRAGNLLDLVLIKEKKGFGMPKPFHPKPGDRFTPHVKRYFATEAGGILQNASPVFSDELLLDGQIRRYFEPALPGTYFAGFMVQDFDGNYYQHYTTLPVI